MSEWISINNKMPEIDYKNNKTSIKVRVKINEESDGFPCFFRETFDAFGTRIGYFFYLLSGETFHGITHWKEDTESTKTTLEQMDELGLLGVLEDDRLKVKRLIPWLFDTDYEVIFNLYNRINRNMEKVKPKGRAYLRMLAEVDILRYMLRNFEIKPWNGPFPSPPKEPTPPPNCS